MTSLFTPRYKLSLNNHKRYTLSSCLYTHSKNVHNKKCLRIGNFSVEKEKERLVLALKTLFNTPFQVTTAKTNTVSVLANKLTN